LRVLDEILERRRLLAERYTAALERIPHLQAPYDPAYAQRTWQSYCVRVASGAPLERTELMRGLLQDGIATRRGVMAIHEEASYSGQAPQGAPDLPHTEAATRETLMLPIFPDLSEDQQDYVLERLEACMLALAA
jgi:perosamine synthetase